MSPAGPPKLVGTREDGGRLVLELSDGARVTVEISGERLARLLERPVSELGRSGVEVFLPGRRMTEEDWHTVRPFLTPAHFSGNERIAALLSRTAEELHRLPLRVYGGTNFGQTLYLSPPVFFTRREDGRFYALLNDGDELWKVWVDVETGAVEVEGGTLPGHFVEPAR